MKISKSIRCNKSLCMRVIKLIDDNMDYEDSERLEKHIVKVSIEHGNLVNQFMKDFLNKNQEELKKAIYENKRK